MASDALTTQRTTRRTITKTGIKLVYAAPVVAASMRFGLQPTQAVSGDGCPECYVRLTHTGQCVREAVVPGECPCGFELTDLGECVKDGCKDCFINVGGICIPDQMPRTTDPASVGLRSSAASACHVTRCSDRPSRKHETGLGQMPAPFPFRRERCPDRSVIFCAAPVAARRGLCRALLRGHFSTGVTFCRSMPSSRVGGRSPEQRGNRCTRLIFQSGTGVLVSPSNTKYPGFEQ